MSERRVRVGGGSLRGRSGGWETSITAESRPDAAAAQDVAELDRSSRNAGNAWSPCILMLLDHLLPPTGDLARRFASTTSCDLVQHDLTAWREERESLLDLAFKTSRLLSPVNARKRSGSGLLALITNEVKGGEDRLILGWPQASTKLLKEHSGALGRPEHEDCVHLGEVGGFVEESAANSALTRSSGGHAIACRRSAGGSGRYKARAGMPALANTRAMYSACATLTQKPSARIDASPSPCPATWSGRW